MTKTLEEIKREGREEFFREFPALNSPITAQILDSLTEKVWTAALDACREKLDSIEFASRNGYANEMIQDFRGEIEEAIDFLRHVGGNE